MKLRSIALAGLLGAGLVMTSGCGKDDVKDILNINTSAVYAVNDLSGDINVTVKDEQKTVESMGIAKVFPTTSQDDKLNVSYDDGASTDLGSTQLNNDGIHVYAATQCDPTKEFLVDTYDGKKVRVMNLTGAAIDKGNVVVTHDGVPVTIPENAAPCAVTSTFTDDTRGIWSVTVDGEAYPDVNLTKNIGFEIVVYSTAPNVGTIVPLVGFDDIL